MGRRFGVLLPAFLVATSIVRLLAQGLLIATTILTGSAVHAQSTLRVEFDVVSIKRHVGTEDAMSMRTLRDGTTMITNATLRTALAMASPFPMRDVFGLRDWVDGERYDIIAKAPDGATRDRDNLKTMWQALFADRMKLAAHTEQRARDAYLLLLARRDGTLGPQLTPSTLDCASARGRLLSPGQTPTVKDLQTRCTVGGIGATMASGGVTLQRRALRHRGKS